MEGKLHSVAYLSITFLELIDQKELRAKHTTFISTNEIEFRFRRELLFFFRIESTKFGFNMNGIELKGVKLKLVDREIKR